VSWVGVICGLCEFCELLILVGLRKRDLSRSSVEFLIGYIKVVFFVLTGTFICQVWFVIKACNLLFIIMNI
jgi:hypothetical protein